MKKTVRPNFIALLSALMISLMLSSCNFSFKSITNAFRGDPRKNCNHPKHYQWVKEQRRAKMKKQGINLPDPAEPEQQTVQPGRQRNN